MGSSTRAERLVFRPSLGRCRRRFMTVLIEPEAPAPPRASTPPLDDEPPVEARKQRQMRPNVSATFPKRCTAMIAGTRQPYSVFYSGDRAQFTSFLLPLGLQTPNRPTQNRVRAVVSIGTLRPLSFDN